MNSQAAMPSKLPLIEITLLASTETYPSVDNLTQFSSNLLLPWNIVHRPPPFPALLVSQNPSLRSCQVGFMLPQRHSIILPALQWRQIVTASLRTFWCRLGWWQTRSCIHLWLCLVSWRRSYQLVGKEAKLYRSFHMRLSMLPSRCQHKGVTISYIALFTWVSADGYALAYSSCSWDIC